MQWKPSVWRDWNAFQSQAWLGGHWEQTYELFGGRKKVNGEGEWSGELWTGCWSLRGAVDSFVTSGAEVAVCCPGGRAVWAGKVWSSVQSVRNVACRGCGNSSNFFFLFLCWDLVGSASGKTRRGLTLAFPFFCLLDFFVSLTPLHRLEPEGCGPRLKNSK